MGSARQRISPRVGACAPGGVRGLRLLPAPRVRAVIALVAMVTIGAPALGAATARAGGVPRFTGAFRGTGRACYGRLDVRVKTISWLTTFSQCKSVPYRLIERHQNGNARQLAFELARRDKGCRYGVIALRHRDDPDPSIGWEAIGYASLADYRADQARGFEADLATALSCYLVKE